jgi:hypothetical protein
MVDNSRGILSAAGTHCEPMAAHFIVTLAVLVAHRDADIVMHLAPLAHYKLSSNRSDVEPPSHKAM